MAPAVVLTSFNFLFFYDFVSFRLFWPFQLFRVGGFARFCCFFSVVSFCCFGFK